MDSKYTGFRIPARRKTGPLRFVRCNGSGEILQSHESAQIISVRHGREKHFRVRAADWHFLLPPPADGQGAFPRWVDWMPLFAAITRIAETLALPGLDGQSEHCQAIQPREALDEAMPALIRAGISHQLRSSRDQRGAHLIQSLLADLDSLPG
jgi:hypothetical protein